MITGKDYFHQLFSAAAQAHQSGDLKKAKALYIQLTRDMPAQPEPFHMLAVIDAQNDHHEKAILNFEKAILLSPKNPLYRTNLAAALVRLGQKEDAIAQLKLALEIDPNFELAKKKMEPLH